MGNFQAMNKMIKGAQKCFDKIKLEVDVFFFPHFVLNLSLVNNLPENTEIS